MGKRLRGWFVSQVSLLGLALVIAGCAAPRASSLPPVAAPVFVVTDVSPAEAQDLMQKNRGAADFVVLDVRTPAEFAAGHIPGAVNVDFQAADFEARLEALDRTRTYLVYCRSGNRSRSALAVMERLAFRRAYHMAAGITGWQAAGLPTVK